MAFFAEKVRRKLPGNFTFLLMTDRNDLDSQIYLSVELPIGLAENSLLLYGFTAMGTRCPL